MEKIENLKNFGNIEKSENLDNTKKFKQIEKRLSKNFTKALKEFNMLSSGDIIAVAVSGGKDSYALLDLFCKRKKHIPIKYNLLAVHIDFGKNDEQIKLIKNFCKERDVEILIKKEKLDPGEKGINCFYCSWMRRTYLFKLVDELKIKKLALGHHQNDLAETLFLNMFYQGKFESFLPNTKFFNGRFNLIRPLCFCKEKNIIEYSKYKKFPSSVHNCPFNIKTNRNKLKLFLNYFDKCNDCVIENISKAWINRIKSNDYKNKGLE